MFTNNINQGTFINMGSESSSFIFQTPNWKVVLNDNQKYLGRLVIILNRPCGDLAEVTEPEMLDFLHIVKITETALTQVFAATMFNWACAMNLAYRETPPNPQVHWHCIPRYDHPVKFADQVFTDAEFGSRNANEVENVSPEVFSKIALALRERFS